jgi:anti-sigma factor RsiW
VTGHLHEELSAFLDGELDTDETLAVQRHLDGCAPCRHELAAIAAVRSAVRSLPLVEPPFGLYERALRRRDASVTTRRALANVAVAAAVWLAVLALSGGSFGGALSVGVSSVVPSVDEAVREHTSNAEAPPHDPAPSRLPDELPGEYRMVGAVRDGARVQVIYSDGSSFLSVFQRPGSIRWSRLPAGGRAVRVGSELGWHWRRKGLDVVVFERDWMTFTVVAPARRAVADAAAEVVPGPGAPSLVDRLRVAGRALFDAFRLER